MHARWQEELAAYRMGRHAMAYARKGWAVFPVWWASYAGVCACREGGECSSPAKHPLVAGGSNVATTDRDQILAWWAKWPHANIGIATGKASGVVVLDIDPGHGGADSFGAARRRHGTPEPTIVSLTGGGGRHIFWKYEPRYRCRQAVLPGVDVRSDGGYVIAPPSLHSCGERYRWHPDGHPRSVAVTEPPAWVQALMVGRSAGTGRSEPMPAGDIIEGSRNVSLFRLACRWQRLGVADEELSNRLHDANKRMCKPPLGESEVEKIVGSALRYPKGA